MANAIYYREGYYLLPEGVGSVDGFVASLGSLPAEIKLRKLRENCGIRSIIQKGVCIAPYFYSDYGFPESSVVIEDSSDIFPVEVTLLSQAEYNERIREVILSYCPGCLRYKPLSKRVQSLNGHFEEISLNSVCFYRQNSKPSPRVFRVMLHFYGGSAKHFDPAGKNAEDAMEQITSRTYLKFTQGEKPEGSVSLTVSFPRNFFTANLTAALAAYIEKHLYFTQFRLLYRPMSFTKSDIEGVLENQTAFQKECKKYGVCVALLQFDDKADGKVKRSLEALFYHDYARCLYEEQGAMYLLLLDRGGFLKELHFRAPFLQSRNTQITVYDQYEVRKYSISFDMESVKL